MKERGREGGREGRERRVWREITGEVERGWLVQSEQNKGEKNSSLLDGSVKCEASF